MNDATPPYVPGPTPPPAYPTPPQPPRRRRRGLLITLISVAAALALCVVGTVIVGLATQGTKPTRASNSTHAPLPQDACGGGVCAATPVADTPTTAAAVVPLTAADIELTVKIKKKDCFGSAGCNVEYTIKAAIGKDVDPQDCEVTYDVHGLEDTQTGTLDFHTDGTYEQDSFQYGDTTSSKKKLTAKVTDVDCS